ncbi:hypothetical protein [Alkalicoccus chagannorensis]|uniref:hypothetical protein n=1 Tax=Alkalicoccus chagannorensis TaxID=427072 RepID=UPI0003FB01B9|nr:hypothetical protein [Alkalicoccus chagannorensis]
MIKGSAVSVIGGGLFVVEESDGGLIRRTRSIRTVFSVAEWIRTLLHLHDFRAPTPDASSPAAFACLEAHS